MGHRLHIVLCHHHHHHHAEPAPRLPCCESPRERGDLFLGIEVQDSNRDARVLLRQGWTRELSPGTVHQSGTQHAVHRAEAEASPGQSRQFSEQIRFQFGDQAR